MQFYFSHTMGTAIHHSVYVIKTNKQLTECWVILSTLFPKLKRLPRSSLKSPYQAQMTFGNPDLRVNFDFDVEKVICIVLLLRPPSVCLYANQWIWKNRYIHKTHREQTSVFHSGDFNLIKHSVYWTLHLRVPETQNSMNILFNWTLTLNDRVIAL